MRNPLLKRLPRELRSEFGKYIVLFAFITGMISIVSGFLVANGSMRIAYDESYEKYNIEDGNFELMGEADNELINTLEKENLTVYNNFYKEENDHIDGTIRIFRNRTEIDRACLMEGSFPQKKDEIAIDRMYAYNNEISTGDILKTGGKTLKVSGLVALSDYSALYSSPSDLMFDAKKFCVAVMTDEGFESFDNTNIHYSYSWIYDNEPEDEVQAKQMSEDFMKVLNNNTQIRNFIPEFSNNAIRFTGDDIKGDSKIFTVFLYIIISIISFIFAITTSNTIVKEASVIGTLRASGYKRRELLIHYITMPVIVMLIAALAGNILGYTLLKNYMADLYYTSYSLPTYKTIWNADAFFRTTVVPLAILFIINLVIISHKLKLSPLKFLKHDLNKNKNKKAFRLNTKIGILKRFRLRIIFQNIPGYIVIIIGVFLANFMLLFGMAITPMLDNYQKETEENLICKNQYVLKTQMPTESGAEKYSISSLSTPEGKMKIEEVMVYGIAPDSRYVNIDFNGNEIYISNAYANKHKLKAGDNITLKEQYNDKEYSFKVGGVYYYPSALVVFMDQYVFNDVFDKDDEFFNGYFADDKIQDIDPLFIASVITSDDMTKTSRQLKLSIGGFTKAFILFGVVMFMLIIYLLSKIIIEKNALSISMVKILGYKNNEINGLYIASTSIVVIASLLATIPVVNIITKMVIEIAFSDYPGWFTYYVPFNVFIEMAALGIVSYTVIAFFQVKKVKKVPMGDAIKSAE